MPTANQSMSADPVTARGGDGFLDVARRMRELHVGCLIIVDGAASERRPIGILTVRDIVVRFWRGRRSDTERATME